MAPRAFSLTTRIGLGSCSSLAVTATNFTVGVTGRAVRTTDEGARAATIQEDSVGGT